MALLRITGSRPLLCLDRRSLEALHDVISTGRRVHWRNSDRLHGHPKSRIAPQIAIKIPDTNSQTLPVRRSATNARTASARRARRSINLKYSITTLMKTPARRRRTFPTDTASPHSSFLRSLRHRHQVIVEVGNDPDRAGDDEKDDQHTKGESQNVVCAVGPAAQMQKEDEMDADLR